MNREPPKPYTAHKTMSKQTGEYEPITPQNNLQRTFGYLMLIAVGIMSPLAALVETFVQGVTRLFGG